jgi:hypothetical protein
MIEVAVAARSAFGAPAVLTIAGHPAVCGVVVSRDLGDAGGQMPTLRGVPCFQLEFVSEAATDEALERLRVISAKFTSKESPTRIACSNGVQYTLRLIHGFDEATIAAIDAHYDEAVDRYAAAQREGSRVGAGRGRR